MSDVDFKQVLSDAGIPVTESAALSRLREIAAEENAPYNNQSDLSPFWRLVSLFFVKPVFWLTELLSNEILPALFLKTASGQWVDLFVWQVGLTRKPATKAKGLITLTRYDATGTLSVPIGTVIQSSSIAGTVYRLEVVEAATFEVGEASLDVVCEAVETGAAYNLATGFYALVATDLAGIASVSNAEDWLLVPGADEETDADLKDRGRNQFSAVNQWHIDAVYKAMLSEWAGVAVRDIYIDSDAPRGPGTANIYILFDHGVPVSETIASMHAYVIKDGHHGFSDDVLIASVPTYPLDVSASVLINPALDVDAQSAVLANVRLFIQIALRYLPNTDFQPTRTAPFVRFVWSNLARELHDQFPDLQSIDFAQDADITASLEQPVLNSLTLTEVLS